MSPVAIKLRERKKELNCLYLIDEILEDREGDIESIFRRIVRVIPPSWQFPDICRAKILFEGKSFANYDYVDTQWIQTADLIADDIFVGEIRVIYIDPAVSSSTHPFLPEEQKLLNAIASMVSRFLAQRKATKTLEIIQAKESTKVDTPRILSPSNASWKWRNKMANIVAEQLDMTGFGVEAIYLFGSTEQATAGPASDIDLLVHFSGDDEQRRLLESWFEGWSLCLSEMNFLKTGYRTDGLLDIHFITEQDIKNRTSYAVIITSVDEPAKLLRQRADVFQPKRGAA